MTNEVQTGWRVGGEMLTPAGTIEILDQRGITVAFSLPKHAQKIAAAPALAEALREADKMCDFIEETVAHFETKGMIPRSGGPSDSPAWMEQRAMIRAALALVDGDA